ncbi:aa3-type cytochrome c oxidase subunit IV [Caulobacter vibrioides]|uniref:Aa3-type cytochrome c oxidase subunit IV n=1 Tax=Caulobacter vibrioides TaxID=155892 RepID=A0A290MMG1_CAUVI|nr:aa3-type cytochrome c oxidase subunit IV [Caulobacter vibrioides]ATC33179.1 aa3-type cytochrome c oxidase subunit IV [Caulobacter vibrioides]
MAGDYHRGEMDIHEQAATYDAFGKMTKWGSLAIAVLLLFFTLLFCTPAGFIGSGIASVVLLVLGVVLLKEKPAESH